MQSDAIPRERDACQAGCNLDSRLRGNDGRCWEGLCNCPGWGLGAGSFVFAGRGHCYSRGGGVCWAGILDPFDKLRANGLGDRGRAWFWAGFFRCWDILGLFRTLGGLPRPACVGVGFWDVGLGVPIVILESRHRCWQGGKCQWGLWIFEVEGSWSCGEGCGLAWWLRRRVEFGGGGCVGQGF